MKADSPILELCKYKYTVNPRNGPPPLGKNLILEPQIVNKPSLNRPPPHTMIRNLIEIIVNMIKTRFNLDLLKFRVSL